MSKINKSWERTRSDTHSPPGVETLRRDVKYGLMRKYIGLAETMFRYDGLDDPKFKDMSIMSQDTVPEIFLFRNGECVWFENHGAIHCLPMVQDNAINIYGKPSGWYPVPVGWTDNLRGDPAMKDIVEMRDTLLNAENSVVMRNDLFGGNDIAFVEAMVNELVDNVMTMNQLQLIAKCPFVFNVTEDNLLSAKNYFLALSSDKPAIFTNANGERPVPVVEVTNNKIDPALFELFDRFECQILEYLGFPCVPITKRAQQSVSEVQSNDAKIALRRREKLRQREMAVDRINEMFGTSLSVVSVIDELQEDAEMDANGTFNSDYDDDPQEERI